MVPTFCVSKLNETWNSAVGVSFGRAARFKERRSDSANIPVGYLSSRSVQWSSLSNVGATTFTKEGNRFKRHPYTYIDHQL